MTNREYITRALLSLLPPGAFKTTEDSHVWNLAFAFAAVIEPAYDNAVQLGNEALPHSAEQMLAEWEKLFNQPSMAGATTAQRQAALVAFWRWAIPPTIPGIRQVLAPPLNPTHQFRDLCDDEDVSWRFETDLGNGVIQEVAGADLQLEATGAADCRWGFGHQRASLDVIDRDDDYWLEVLLEAPTLNADGGGGLLLFQDMDNTYIFGPQDIGGTSYLALRRFLGGKETVIKTLALPSSPFWAVASRQAGEFIFEYGAALGSLTAFQTEADIPINPIKLGLASYNTASGYNLQRINADTVQVRYGKPENNVEIIEMTLANLPSNSDDRRYFCFVHRDPTDTGDNNLALAQRVADKVKHAHTLVLVGQSDCARWDDPYSLYDRDIYGK